MNCLCGRLDNSESFSSASQTCITRTPTAALRLLGLRKEGHPQSPSVFSGTWRAFQKALRPHWKCATVPAAFWNSTFLVWQGESVLSGSCRWSVWEGGQGSWGICRYWHIWVNAWLQTLGNSRVYKKVFTKHLQARSFCKGLFAAWDSSRSSHCV